MALLHGELSSLGWHPNGLMNNLCPQGSGHEAVKVFTALLFFYKISTMNLKKLCDRVNE